MPDTLADLVRKRYPGKYDSLDDDTLEDKFVKRYPGKYEHLMPPKRNAPPDALKVDNPDVDTIVADARKSAFGRSVPEEGLDAAGKPKFTIDDMPQAEKPKQYETVGPPLPQAENEQTPTAAPKVEEKPSLGSRIWKGLTETPDAIKHFSSSLEDYLTDPNQQIMQEIGQGGIHNKFTEGHDTVAEGLAVLRGGLAGSLKAGIDQFTSPLNLGLAAAGLTEAKAANPLIKAGAKLTRFGLSAPVAYRGLDKITSPDSSWSDRAAGVAELAGGILGMTHGTPMSKRPIERIFHPNENVIDPEYKVHGEAESAGTPEQKLFQRERRSTEIPYRMEPQAPPEEGLPVRQQTQQTVTEAPIQRFMRENPEASMSDIEKFIRSMSATQSDAQGIAPQQDLPVRAEDPFTAGATEQRTDIISQPGGPEFAPTDAIATPEDQAAQPKTDPEENIYTQAINKFNMGKPLPTAPKVQASDLRPDAPYVPVSPFKTVEPQAAIETPPESALPAKQEPPTATHIGSQPTAEGTTEDLFNIESGPDKGSTVTRAGLEQRGIPVPTIDQSKQGKSGEQLRAEALAAKKGKKKELPIPNTIQTAAIERIQQDSRDGKIEPNDALDKIQEVLQNPDKYQPVPSKFKNRSKPKQAEGLAPALPDESVMDYHNRTGASISDSEKATGNAPEESIEPSFARTESGGVRMDIGDRKAMINIFKNTYAGEVPQVAAKELIQNAIDAANSKPGGGGQVSVSSSEKDKTITVADNGAGLNRDQIDTVFTNLSESGKRGGEVKTIGELGVGKTTYLVAGEHVDVSTVHKDPQTGKKIKITFNGTPHEIMEEVHPVEEEVPQDTPTGTIVKVRVSKDSKFEGMKRYFKNLKDYSAVSVPVDINHEGLNSYNNESHNIKPKVQSGGKFIGEGIAKTGARESTKFKITIPDDAVWGETDRIALVLNNRGMFQGVDSWYTGKAEIPDRVVIDLDPLVPGDDTIYPLTAPTRERLKEDVKYKIGGVIDKELVDAQRKKREAEIQRIFDNLKNTRGMVIYNGGERLTTDELAEFRRTPVMRKIDKIGSELIKELHDLMPTKTSYGAGRDIVRTGFIFDDLRGVNLQNPGSPNELVVLVNPFIEIESYFSDPSKAAQGIVHILLHEFTHAHVRNEGSEFTAKLATVHAEFPLEKQLAYRNKILRAISEVPGDGSERRYNSEIESLLYKYNESRGRPKSGTDVLLREAGSYVLRSEKPKGSSGDGGDAGEGTTSGAISRAVANLMEALESVRDTIGEQQEINRSERASRFKNFERTKGSGIDWASKAFSKMKGEHEKADYFSEKQLSKKDVNTLFSAIKNAKVPTQEKVRAVSGMFKILNGDVPVQSEVNVLDDIFGGGFRDKIVQMHGGIGGFGPVRVKLAETANTMKAMKSMLDVSAALRQGAGLALSPGFSKNGIQFINPAYRDAFQMMFKFFYDKKAYNAAMQAIIDDPDYIGARRAGLFLAKPGNLIKAEEAFGKNLIGYLKPIPGLNVIPIAEEASERAYTGFLNMLRFQTYKNLIKNAKDAGHVMEKTKQLRDKKGDFKLDEDGNVKTTSEPTKIAKDIAYYINVTTGRGSLGKLEKIVPELNVVLWSPRNVSSRLTMLNPMYYKGLSNFARFEAMKSLFSIAAIATTLLALAKLRGAKISGNVLSADFGKARMPGSARPNASQIVVDPYTGLQQVVVAAARLTAESHRMVTGGKRAYNQENLLGIAGNFLANKESPIASFAHDLATAQSINFNDRSYVNKYGQKKNINPEIVNTIMPMIIQDATDVFKSDAKFADQVGLDAVSLLGVGVQNYPETKPQTSKFRKMSIPNR